MDEAPQIQEAVRRGPGRPATGKSSRISPEDWEAFLADLEAQKAAGIRPSVTHAAKKSGHTRQTMFNARKRPEYEEYAKRWSGITGNIPSPGRMVHPSGKGTVIAKGTETAPVGATVENRLATKGLLEIKHDIAKKVYHAGLGEKLANVVRLADETTKEGKADVLSIGRFIEVPLMPKEVASEATVTHKKANPLDSMTDEEIAERLVRVGTLVQKIQQEKREAREITP